MRYTSTHRVREKSVRVCGCYVLWCTVPGNAQYFAGSDMCASSPLSIRLLARCNPSGCDGPEGVG